MHTELQDLNENQLSAVKWSKGPLLVLAGPGSGKTLVLTLRIAELIRRSRDKRFRILALTFTNKASVEMRDRVNEVVSDGADRALLTTFHSFAADILRQHGSHINLAPDFTILNEDEDRVEVLRDAISELSAADENVKESDVGLLPLLTNLLEKLVPEGEVAARIRDRELGKKVSLLYRAYRMQLVSARVLDFVSLIAFAYELLSERPAIAQHYRTVYPYICVDAFQDTNFAQYQFLRAIVGESPSDLFVVADDDQIVYQWNGADPRRLEELRQHYRMAVIQLPQNYRCPEPIIDLANNLIRYNPSHSPEKLPLRGRRGGTTERDVVTVRSFPSPEEEVQWVAKDVGNRPETERRNCMILARTRALVEKAAAALECLQIPYTLSIKKNEFVSAPLRWMHGMLRLANARGDREQLRRVCKAFYELEGIDIRVPDVTAAASAEGGDLFRSWLGEALARKQGLDPKAQVLLAQARISLGDKMDFKPFVASAFKWFDFLMIGETMAQQGLTQSVEPFADYEEEKQVWGELCSAITNRYGNEEISLNILLQEMDLLPKQTLTPPNAVRCYTIHTAKGMEFDYVYLIGLAEDILPSYQSIKRGEHSREMQEERRSCFVAVTRTRRNLVLTYSRKYYGYDKQPSRFLREMGLTHRLTSPPRSPSTETA